MLYKFKWKFKFNFELRHKFKPRLKFFKFGLYFLKFMIPCTCKLNSFFSKAGQWKNLFKAVDLILTLSYPLWLTLASLGGGGFKTKWTLALCILGFLKCKLFLSHLQIDRDVVFPTKHAIFSGGQNRLGQYIPINIFLQWIKRIHRKNSSNVVFFTFW